MVDDMRYSVFEGLRKGLGIKLEEGQYNKAIQCAWGLWRYLEKKEARKRRKGLTA
jgi:hypothetical protein